MTELCVNSRRPRILIVRLSAVGDVIHGVPVLCALRERFPEAFLGWVVGQGAAPLVEGHPALDEVITVSRRWLKSPRAVRHLRRRLRGIDFDVVVDLQGLAKSAIAGRLSGARQRIGFGDQKGRELSPWLYTDKVRTTSAHVIDCNLELLRPLGITNPAVRFDLPERPADGARAEQILHEAGLDDAFALITPGAGWPSKVWPAERFAQVADFLGRERGLPSMIVWAGDQERAWARQIAAESRGQAIPAPDTSLLELAALARRARLFIGSDTGPTHLAAAVGTACVGLYGPMPAERNGPYGPGHVALEKTRFDGTSRQRRNAPREVIESIQVQDVADACDQILAQKKRYAA